MSGANEQRGGNETLGKLLAICMAAGAYCLVTAGASAVMMAATNISAQARGGGHGGGGHGGGGHGGGGHAGGHASHGGYGHGHFIGGGGEHFWHGHWWRYGVGPCWRWTPAGYIWIC
jgi:hypothetical protein